MENPIESGPLFPHIADPRYPFLSSEFEMQAVGTKNRTSLHSIDGSAFKTRGSLSFGISILILFLAPPKNEHRAYNLLHS